MSRRRQRNQRFAHSGSATKIVLKRPLPPGIVFAVPANAVPDGTLVCDGTSVSRRRYPELYAHLQSKYGAPAGASILLPDLNGRGMTFVGAHADVSALNANDGLANASRTPKHAHTAASHQHGGVSHQHTSASHGHTGESHNHDSSAHDHASPNHNHAMTGTSAATTQNKTAATGTNTAADGSHQHDDGSLVSSTSADLTNTGTTAPGGTGFGSANHDTITPGATDPSSIASTQPTTPANVDPGNTPYFTVLWVITTGR